MERAPERMPPVRHPQAETPGRLPLAPLPPVPGRDGDEHDEEPASEWAWFDDEWPPHFGSAGAGIP